MHIGSPWGAGLMAPKVSCVALGTIHYHDPLLWGQEKQPTESTQPEDDRPAASGCQWAPCGPGEPGKIWNSAPSKCQSQSCIQVSVPSDETTWTLPPREAGLSLRGQPEVGGAEAASTWGDSMYWLL